VIGSDLRSYPTGTVSKLADVKLSGMMLAASRSPAEADHNFGRCGFEVTGLVIEPL
jgi:hypothetical protein